MHECKNAAAELGLSGLVSGGGGGGGGFYRNTSKKYKLHKKILSIKRDHLSSSKTDNGLVVSSLTNNWPPPAMMIFLHSFRFWLVSGIAFYPAFEVREGVSKCWFLAHPLSL